VTGLYEFFRQLYLRLPISPGLRYRIGHMRRRWMRRGLAVVQVDASDIAGLQVPIGQTAESVAQAVRFPPPVEHQPDWVFFGVIDWHFRHQRPQQLALALARAGRRVFYISVNFVDSPEPGFELERLDPALPLFQVFFRLPGRHSVYAAPPSDQTLRSLQSGQLALWESAAIREAVHVVQHPYWLKLACFLPPARVIYDCMDFHAGFEDTGDAHAEAERRLFSLADLTVVTSDYLAEHARRLGVRHLEIVRNAAEFEHFNAAAVGRAQVGRPGRESRPVLGYYGAIAEWFDPEIVARLSIAFPQVDIVLIGADTARVAHRLAGCGNVTFTGEKPYAELPTWLAGFDVCLIPFRITELTLATNPVKVYEYLSAGKPVVSVDLPELQPFGDLVYRAADADHFVASVKQALAEVSDPGSEVAIDLKQRRTAFAALQTWAQRASEILRVSTDRLKEPKVSVVVVAYNQWALTQRCLASLMAHDDAGPLEIIVVDNASADQTPERLQAWAEADPSKRQVILNANNRGFGPAVNQGLAVATGDYLVVLNNDTIVGPGWARGMRRHFEVDPRLGLICPITNNIGNEAQVALKGGNPEEVFASARHYSFQRSGQLLPLNNVAFFCVMMPRHVYVAVGPMDEQFVPGFFEDDDYCLRVREKGWSIGCAEDVFVFHELSASFDAEGSARRQSIFERNKALFEKKWGTWKPHVYRPESLPRP
jgi:GT2 family glycosyltransferase/glycosyltransferase involved in cell wall biosynthesis